MPTIMLLAPEILETILQQLSPHDLTILAITCKTLQLHAEPVLYHSFLHTLYRSPRERDRLPQLIRTLNQRPDLAHHVKKVTIKVVQVDQPVLQNYTLQELDAFDIDAKMMDHVYEAAYASYLAETQDDGYDGREYLPQRYQADELYALLFSRTPNLEIVRMDSKFARFARRVHHSLKDANCTSRDHHGFRRLKEVSINTRFGGAAAAYYSGVLYWGLDIPSLESLEFGMKNQKLRRHLQKTLSSSPPILPGLKSLRINHAHHDTVPELAQMLSYSPRLQKLEYHYVQTVILATPGTYPSQDTHINSVIVWKEFGTALDAVKTTLRQLAISVDHMVFNDLEHGQIEEVQVPCHKIWQRKGCIGSLECLTELKRLELPLFVLLGWDPQTCFDLGDVLPSGLQELCLRDDLVDEDARSFYPWMPWYRNKRQVEVQSDDVEEIEDIAIGNRITNHYLEERCRRNCDPSLIIDQIRKYLSGKHNLRVLTIKTLQGRSWPKEYVCALAGICKTANVVCKFHGRLTNYGEEVKETIVEVRPSNGGFSPEYKYTHRLIEENRGGLYERNSGASLAKPWGSMRLFYEGNLGMFDEVNDTPRSFMLRNVGVRDENVLIAEVEELVGMGCFENFPVGSTRHSGRIVDGDGASSQDFEQNGGWPIGYD